MNKPKTYVCADYDPEFCGHRCEITTVLMDGEVLENCPVGGSAGKVTWVEVETDLNEILKECARLRGVYRLQHRILKEFDWFVGTIIFKTWENLGPDYMEAAKLKKYADRPQTFKNDENALLDWGRLFLEYYREQAEEWEKEMEDEIKELFEDGQ